MDLPIDSSQSGLHKLSPDAKLYLVTQLAQFIPVTQIIKDIQKTYKVTLTPKAVYKYRENPKWQIVMRSIRERYCLNLGEVAGFWKRVRLDRLERLYQRAEKTGSIDLARKIIESQRVEVEGDKDYTTINYIHNELTVMSDKEIEERRIQVVKKLENLNLRKQID